MKALRYIATFLLLAAGVLHIFLFIQKPMATGSAALVLVFGIIYFAVGILLLLKIKYSFLSGIIIPLIGLIVGLMIFDPTEGDPLLGILGILDVLVIILCSIQEWDRKRKSE